MIIAATAATVVVLAIAITAVVLLTRENPAKNPAAAPSASQATQTPTGDAPTSPAPATGTPAAPASSGAPTPGPPTPPANCANCQMTDGVAYHIGGTGARTARAGQYHSDGPTSADGCAIKVVRAGKTIVEKTYFNPADLLVRDGDDFSSQGCKTWKWTSAG
jgi:hypothetical protein